MDDLISRKDAIKAIMSEPADAHYPSWYALIVCNLSSAEFATDLISRHDALEALRSAIDKWNISDMYHEGIKMGLICAARIITSLRFAQPEPSEEVE